MAAAETAGVSKARMPCRRRGAHHFRFTSKPMERTMKNAKALTLAGAVALAVTFAASTAMAGNCWSHGQKDTTAETTKPKPKTKKDGANA